MSGLWQGWWAGGWSAVSNVRRRLRNTVPYGVIPDYVSFLSEEDKVMIQQTIREMESKTSGEVRVHVEPFAGHDPYHRAVTVFNKLGMSRTRDRTGVLICVFWASRRCVIIGDCEIYRKVPEHIWGVLATDLAAGLRNSGGISTAARPGLVIALTVRAVGSLLGFHFPRKPGDTDELPNTVSEFESESESNTSSEVQNNG